MIEINLLPEELRVKKAFASKFDFVFNLIPAFLAIIILLNVIVILVTSTKNIQLGILNKKWESLVPEKKKVDEYTRKSSVLSEDAKAAQQLLNIRVIWASRLNKLSLLLPGGVWFRDISLSNKNFLLRGSAISLKKEEMGLINLFLTTLKNDRDFFSDFNNLELTSVERKSVGGYEVIDFVFSGSIKSK